MKSKAADKLIKDCRAWEAAYKSVFHRALALIESAPARPEPEKPGCVQVTALARDRWWL
ncbi:hypothetical protein [Nonomuraea pusilla]|uniref:hypothetical protein n=1 Tax=Nonomuraea pusilla TaxID=46177 RepID=UPI003318E4F7